MSQSLTAIYVHIIFHVKQDRIPILKDDRAPLYAYIGSIIKDTDSIPIRINGTWNHVHILCRQSKNISLADLLEEMKKHSSRWIKSRGDHYKYFKWQGGYSGYSVSQSVVNTVIRYIENQEIHHQKIDFKEEYIQLLKRHQVDYNEDYLWND